MNKIPFLKFIGLLTLLFCFINTNTKAQAGIGHTQITFQDPARNNRAIQTEIYYPSVVGGNNGVIDAGTFPIIAFGHGFVMVWSAYDNIWIDLVAKGYVVAFPITEIGFSPNHTEFGKDLAFLIAKLKSEGANNPQSLFYNHLAATSAIMGHSMGGGSTFLAAENNANITTIVTLAAAVTTPSSVTAAQNITVPALVLSGSNDCVAPPVNHQKKMYDSLTSNCKAYVEIKGGGHCYFANSNFNCSFGEGTCMPNPTITRSEQQSTSSDFITLWLNYYLKNDCLAWDQFNDSLNVSPRISHNQNCIVTNPVISFSNNNLQSTTATSYQWYLNGNAINGATSQLYTPVQSGSYMVKVTYYTNCEYSSNIINWTGVESFFDKERVIVFPNPASNVLQVSAQLLNPSIVSIVVYDLLNEKLFSCNFKNSMGNTIKSIDISSLNAGVYYVEVSINDQKNRYKFIKN